MPRRQIIFRELLLRKKESSPIRAVCGNLMKNYRRMLRRPRRLIAGEELRRQARWKALFVCKAIWKRGMTLIKGILAYTTDECNMYLALCTRYSRDYIKNWKRNATAHHEMFEIPNPPRNIGEAPKTKKETVKVPFSENFVHKKILKRGLWVPSLLENIIYYLSYLSSLHTSRKLL